MKDVNKVPRRVAPPVMALLLLTSVAHAGTTEGIMAYEQKDYVTALRELQPEAERGDVEAMLRLGWMYRYGDGVPEDVDEALKWYLRAAERGHARAMADVGMVYHFNTARRDYLKAFEWYSKSAAAGNAMAHYHLGQLYAKGLGVTRDPHEAITWYRKAAHLGHKPAYSELGVIYAAGELIPADWIEASNWFKKAADSGDAQSAYNLGQLYADGGHGLESDDQEAFVWFHKAAEKDHLLAQIRLAYMYKNGRGVTENLEEAIKWMKRAAEKDDAEAQYELGELYERNLEWAEAVRWYKKAIEPKAKPRDTGLYFPVDLAKRRLRELHAIPGVVATDFIGVDLAGKRVQLSDSKGKVILVVFWRTGCGYCRTQLQTVDSLAQHFARHELSILSVALDPKEFVQEFQTKYKVNVLPVVLDKASRNHVDDFYSIRAVPTSFLIRKDGTIAYRVPWAIDMTDANFIKFVRQMIQE